MNHCYGYYLFNTVNLFTTTRVFSYKIAKSCFRHVNLEIKKSIDIDILFDTNPFHSTILKKYLNSRRIIFSVKIYFLKACPCFWISNSETLYMLV